VPLTAPGLHKEQLLTAGLWPFAADGKINSFIFDRDRPVKAHKCPGLGSLIQSGRCI